MQKIPHRQQSAGAVWSFAIGRSNPYCGASRVVLLHIDLGKATNPMSALPHIKGIQSVEQAGRLLAALAEAGGPMSLSQLAKASAMSASSARRYLISLERIGLISQEDATGLYDLSWFALQLGLAALSRREIVGLSKPLLRRLSVDQNVTCALVIWAASGPIVAHFEEANHGILRVAAPIGTVLPLMTTAAGQVFAAWLPPETTAPIIVRELERRRITRTAVDGPLSKNFDSLLQSARKRGLVRMTGSEAHGIDTIAAPVFGSEGKLLAAVVALGFKGGFDSSWTGTVAIALRKTATELSRNLGYQGLLIDGS